LQKIEADVLLAPTIHKLELMFYNNDENRKISTTP
jgi:hypothetical protein